MAAAKKQLCYEDVDESSEIPPLKKFPSYVQLFLVSAVKHIAHRIHYDQAFAHSEEHPDVLVHGSLRGAFLAQVLTDWIGDQGFLKKLSYSSRGRAIPGDVLTYKGKVTKKYQHEGKYYVDCDVWEENQRGETMIRGSATVILPSRKNTE